MATKNFDAKAHSVISSLCVLLLMLSFQFVRAAEAALLDCEREGGYGPVQIYIDEAQMYVLYNAQVRSSYERHQEYSVAETPGETVLIDDGLDIHANTDRFIQASDENSSFVFVKKDATFAYAWTTLVPLVEGGFLAFGNNHSGKCSVNPFNQPGQ